MAVYGLEFLEIFENLGFPVGMVAYFIWNTTTVRKQHIAERDDWVKGRDHDHAVLVELMQENNKVVANNTLAISRLEVLVDELKKDVDAIKVKK